MRRPLWLQQIQGSKKSQRRLHLAFCAAVSLAVTAVAVTWDISQISARQLQEGLQWARQVASQTEGLTLQAREEGRRDPVGWAAGHLAQGIEPRRMIAMRVVNVDLDAQAPESFELDRLGGTFDYNKLILPEEGTGIRVHLSLGYVGFLGAASPFANDLLALLFFCGCYVIAFFSTGRLFGFDDTGRIRKYVLSWVGGAKAQLTQLGVHIREMVRQSQRLAVSSGRARQQVSDLRAGIHAGLAQAHDSHKIFDDAEAAAALAEALMRRALAEAQSAGRDPKRMAELMAEIQRCVGILRDTSRKGQLLVHTIEKSIEPWATDADLAFHAFDEVKEATDSLSHHIRSTTETLIGQAKLIQSLNYGIRENPGESQTPGVTAAVDSDQNGLRSIALVAPETAGAPGTKLPEPLPPIQENSAKTHLFGKIRRRKKSA